MKRIRSSTAFFLAVFLAGCQSPEVLPLETQSSAPTQPAAISTRFPSTASPPAKTATLTEIPTPHPSLTPVPPGVFTGWLAFVAYHADYPVLYAIHQDGYGLTTLVDHLSGIGSPSWSPDGKKIAFHANSPIDGLWDIFILEADGSALTHLHIPEENFYPAWSPDGGSAQRIAFVSNHEGLQTDLYGMDSDGTHPTRLTRNATWQRLLAWSPDGARLLFSMAANLLPAGTEKRQCFDPYIIGAYPCYDLFIYHQQDGKLVWVSQTPSNSQNNLAHDGCWANEFAQHPSAHWLDLTIQPEQNSIDSIQAILIR